MSDAPTREASAGCVLFVDDEPAVLNVGQRFLNMSGFEVLGAESGTAAIRCFEEHGSRIDLAVLDVSLPDMTGPEVLRRLRTKKPGIRALLTSGYPLTDLDGVEQPVAFLQKPYKLKQLVEAVQRLVHGQDVDGGG